MTPSDRSLGPPADGEPDAAFGELPSANRWTSRRVRLAALLACLAGALAALLTVRGGLFEVGGAGAQARGFAIARGCPGAGAPEVPSVPAAGFRALRDEVSGLLSAPVARVYQAGSVATPNLWSDNEPSQVSSSTLPGGYEVRWWALDRLGGEDDVVADVLRFASPEAARDALARAASLRCRPDGHAYRVGLPAGAINVSWVNPDRVREWDVLFARGRQLYRVDDVPPEYLLAAAAARGGRLGPLLPGSTVDRLACSIAPAGCSASGRSSLASSLATLAPASPGRPLTRSQAIAYAHAVNLRGYDVPGAVQVGREGPVSDAHSWHAFVRCTRELGSLKPSAAVRSPVFSYAGRLRYELVDSSVVLLQSPQQAESYVEVLAGERGRRCAADAYDRWWPHLRAGGVRFEAFTATPLQSPALASYRGPGPYHATALRVLTRAIYTTRRGRRARLPVYLEGFAFAYGRAVVTLGSLSLLRPFPQANQGYLRSALFRRAEVAAF